MIGSSALGRAG